jgi:hypothetical protein
MIGWIAYHAHTFARATTRLLRAPFATLFNVTVIAVALAVPAALYLMLINVQQAARSIKPEPQLTVFLTLDANAEDVAAALERLAGEAQPESAPQGEAAYLYRPEFAGREAPLERLSALLERARAGAGALALITGESGLGKTRLVLELGARAVTANMTVLTGECTPVGAQRLEEGVRGEPLHPFRNFLVAVADACRAGGTEVTERLLGGRC